MATVKDIARIAGVSHGTVSNVLNGRPGVSISKARRVEEAIREAGYVPDANARSLKTSSTRSVAVILPNIVDSHFSQIFTGIERVLVESGYSVGLFITTEIAAKERLVLDQILRKRFDGVVIATCQPSAKDCFERLRARDVKVVFVEREHEEQLYNFAYADTYAALTPVVERLLDGPAHNLFLFTGPDEYTSERHAIRAFVEAHERRGIALGADHLVVTSYDRESAFRGAMRVLRSSRAVDAVVATSTQIVEGVMKAYAVGAEPGQKRPDFVSLSENSWTGAAYEGITQVGRSSIKLGEVAAELLLENFDHGFLRPRRVGVETPAPSRRAQSGAVETATPSRPLRVLALRSTGAEALQSLLPNFRSLSNVDVGIETLEYDDLYEAISSGDRYEGIDVFQVDTPWLPEIVREGRLECLDGYLKEAPEAISDLVPGIIATYALSEGHYYALPYLLDTQLLFYRKDLIEDDGIRRQYYQQRRSALKAPETWGEFNEVASFFSRAHNPDSPVRFGTTLGGRFSSGAVCEFLPRLWGHGGDVFDSKGNVTLDSPEAIKALESYSDSFEYASVGSSLHYWDEQVAEFLAGDAAMMMLFVAHATQIADRSVSKVVGKLGYGLVPGKAGLLGGWSLGMNPASDRKAAAFQFMSWATGKEMAIPSTVLGASTSSLSLYKSSELLDIYPWLAKSLESFGCNRRRWLPDSLREAGLSEREFEKIVGFAVHSCITGTSGAAEALRSAAGRLRDFGGPGRAGGGSPRAAEIPGALRERGEAPRSSTLVAPGARRLE